MDTKVRMSFKDLFVCSQAIILEGNEETANLLRNVFFSECSPLPAGVSTKLNY